MGNTLAQTQLNHEKLRNVGLNKLWGQFTSEKNMNYKEFFQFTTQLARNLELAIGEETIEEVFGVLQKDNQVAFGEFSMTFDSWCKRKIEESLGTEVLQPTLKVSRVSKEYEVYSTPNNTLYKKFLYSNPDTYEKQLLLTSSNPSVLVLRKNTLCIKPQNKDYIHLKIETPESQGQIEATLTITHQYSDEVEEALLFKVSVEPERVETPVIRHSSPGARSISKGRSSWGSFGRNPSPRRNS